MSEEQRQQADIIPSLDGIRALAVGLVCLAHGGLERWVPGGLGVTIFFVLSGYLITTLMRLEHARSGTLNYRAFYLRRALRLMPPLMVVVALAMLLSALDLVDGEFSLGGLLSVLFYFGNYHVIAQDFAGLPSGIGVVWSLAVEEHFYLFYPPLALLLLRAGQPRETGLVLGALCVAVLAWRCYLALLPGMEAHITMATDTRIDAILAGCLMGFLRNPRLDPVAPSSPLRDLAVIAICGGLLLATLLLREEYFRLTLRYTVQSLAIAPLIYLAVARPQAWYCRWLNTRALVYVGGVSYSIYLCHHLFLGLVHKHWPQLGAPAVLALGLLLTLAVAEPMRRWVERPCAELRRRLHRRPGSPAPLLVGRTPGVA